MTKTVTIDSSVFVASLVTTEKSHHRALEIIESVIEEKVRVILPYTILVEVTLAIVRRTGKEDLAEYVKDFMLNSVNIEFVSLNRIRSLNSIDIGFNCRTRGMDAIVLGVVKEFNTELIAFDKEMMDCYEKFLL